jgi:hypothetical protein
MRKIFVPAIVPLFSISNFFTHYECLSFKFMNIVTIAILIPITDNANIRNISTSLSVYYLSLGWSHFLPLHTCIFGTQLDFIFEL